jgi:hypothetical protein
MFKIKLCPLDDFKPGMDSLPMMFCPHCQERGKINSWVDSGLGKFLAQFHLKSKQRSGGEVVLPGSLSA